MDPPGTAYSDAVGADLPKDAMIISSKTTLVNEQYKRVYTNSDGLYNHHLTFVNMNKHANIWLACNGTPVPETTPWTIFIGSEAGEVKIPWTPESKTLKSGYYVGKNDYVALSIDIVNYNNQDVVVYADTEIEYLPGRYSEYGHGEQRLIPVGLCDSKDTWRGSTSIHPPAGKKKIVWEGKTILRS